MEMEPQIRVLHGDWTPASVIQDIVDSGVQEDPFYVMDLGELVARYQRWTELMPRVEPFYAVKCNDERLLVGTLAALGAGFDCASKAEIELVTSLGVASKRIIFAHPAKMSSHIRRAAELRVKTLTFDSEAELHKIKHVFPDAQLMLRIRYDSATVRCPLGQKFGCNHVTEAPKLLKVAAMHQLNVIGISFHVGSGVSETKIYERAIIVCRKLFNFGTKLGHNMRLLDIGGGFPGMKDSDIFEVSQVINAALSTHFADSNVRVIAEPGRYFACAAYTLAAKVHYTREIVSENGEKHTMYFINDGVYGSFNCILYDQRQAEQVVAVPLKPSSAPESWCSVWGPSCNALDRIVPSARLPPMLAGDWLMFPDMGAYTLTIASPYNGFPLPTVQPVVDAALWAVLKDMLPLSTSVFTEEPISVPQISDSEDSPLSDSLETPSPPRSPMLDESVKKTLISSCSQ